MSALLRISLFIFLSLPLFPPQSGAQSLSPDYPVLRHYDQYHLAKIVLPIGGIMTGFEYVAATGMLYEGQTDSGLLCIRNIRDPFDGRKRNPFDEIECGHHYARAMASWTSTLALSGFHYSGPRRKKSFAQKPGTWLWSNGYAWGTIRITAPADATTSSKSAPDPSLPSKGLNAELKVLHGQLALDECSAGQLTHRFKKGNSVKEGETTTFGLE